MLMAEVLVSYLGICVAGYDYEGQQFDTIDQAMEAKVFDGKSLVDIWDEIFPQVS